jgi:acetolactate synthase-1/2/3 large subunit
LVLDEKGPVICEVLVHPDKKLVPKLSSYQKEDGRMESRPLEDLEPLLDRETIKSIMINPIYGETQNE